MAEQERERTPLPEGEAGQQRGNVAYDVAGAVAQGAPLPILRIRDNLSGAPSEAVQVDKSADGNLVTVWAADMVLAEIPDDHRSHLIAQMSQLALDVLGQTPEHAVQGFDMVRQGYVMRFEKECRCEKGEPSSEQ